MNLPGYLLSFVVLFASIFLIVGPLEAASKKSTPPSSVASQEITLHHLINKERQKYGLPPLVVWDALSHQARQHSIKMANGETPFGHAGFEKRAKAVQNEARCYSVGENVAYTLNAPNPLQYAVEMWMESPGHRENILGDYCEGGIGMAYKQGYCYITQLFSKRVK